MGDSEEVTKLRKDGKDRHLDDEIIQSLIDNKVTSLQQLIYFDDEDFNDLKLKGYKLRQLKAVIDKLKTSEDCQDNEEEMDEGCRELLQDKGLTEETMKALARIGVLRRSNLEVLTTKDIEGLKLKSAAAALQRKILRKLVDDMNRPTVAGQGGISMSGVKATFGHVSGHSSVGVAKLENASPGSGGIEVKDSKFDVGNVQDNSTAHMVDIKNKPMPRATQPDDLDLETTDELINVMSDGPLPESFSVDPCSPEFHVKRKEGAYSMEKAPRGRALIINVNKVGEEEPRLGTDVDRDKLQRLFEQLHFRVTVFNDSDGLSGKEILDKVKAFAGTANEEKGEAYVVCLLSHGQDDSLYGTDGKLLPFEEVFCVFDDKRCPNLVGKPKMFFIEACRIEDPDPYKPRVKEGGRSDMLVCFATQAGYKAYRDETKGSWFVAAMTSVFAHFAKHEDIIHMMFRVHYAVQKKLQLQTAEYISPEIRLTLGRKLYFFPGIQV